jgi:hypothetical protein
VAKTFQLRKLYSLQTGMALPGKLLQLAQLKMGHLSKPKLANRLMQA